METALRKRLMDTQAVTDLVAEWKNLPCIFWSVRPEGSPFPAIVLTLVSDARDQSFTGFISTRSTRVQIDCYSTDYAQAAALREAVIAAVVPEATVAGTKFQRAFVNNVLDRGDQTEADGFIHRQLIDLTIWHSA